MNDGDDRLTGVRGWLLVLCVFLGVLDPIFGAFGLAIGVEAVRPEFDQDPGLMKLVLISGTYVICLLVYSLYAGLSLWRKVPGAVKMAKGYFLALTLNVPLSFVLPHLIDLSEKHRAEMLTGVSLNGFVVLGYTLGWYLYLMRSKRVKATYGD